MEAARSAMLWPFEGEGAWMNRRGFLAGLAAGPLAVAVGGPRQARLGATQLRLSPRERQVLALCAGDLSVSQMGRELCIGQHAVRTYMRNILTKLEMSHRLEAATFAKGQRG
jgi:DNA-binding CsgD family transcriptional regulator